MQLCFCRLRTHQWCFLLFNVLLFHALLFGADFVEECLLQPMPRTYTDVKVLEVRERARKLDLSSARANDSQQYVISSPRACARRDVFLLTLVFSAPENGSRREDIRRTWANRTHIQGFMIQTLFLLGSSRSPITQATIRMENKRYGDIIQARFIDSLRNQTPKTVLAMRWVVTYCPIARFILLTDETTFVNLQSLGEYLLTLRRHPEDLYLGRVVHQQMPDRNPSSTRYLSLSQYPDKYFPDYCAGSAFVLSQDVARKVYVASKEVASPVPYDVFVGLCVRRAGVVPMHSSRFSGQKHVRYNSCCYQFLFSSADVTAAELSSVWEDLRDTRPCSLLETYSGLVTCKTLTYLDKFSFFNTGTVNEVNLYG
ncbi:beta-1,3-galactosyltransferase 9 [Brienomyrus brachyistius]|uniref:beta-1,3-galactosyltransferase 9 n=1 Tax=Brienomyrus brachyistius TaxID=42636 RepID=UPI0020B191B0|nr:beta-1,3-galactosyltransferase 9 [Brienomyrus brachyistius]